MGDTGLAVGTATVLGSATWESPIGVENVLVAATARHCLTNLAKFFGIREPRQLFPGISKTETVNPPWILCGSRSTVNGFGLWHAFWLYCGYDDLAIMLLRPVDDVARNTTFHQPVISFYSPEVGTELWAFGFDGCRTVEESDHNFATGMKLSKGKILQYLDGTRQERWVTDIPFQDGMSGGPVFWKDRLVGMVSSTLNGENGICTFVMRIQQIIHFELPHAPMLNGKQHENLQELAESSIIATLPTCERVHSVLAVP